MAIVDERGRLFGRWNLLDLAVVVVLIGLIPMAYAAYLLFRDQPPTLVSVSPNQVIESQEFQLTINGTNLRPYMRISAGAQQARGFLFKSTEEAQLPFAYLAPGTYDIVLYDSARERFRLKDALTVTPMNLPATDMIAVGAFGNLDAAGAAKLKAGSKLAGLGEIISIGKPAPDQTTVFAGPQLVTVPAADRLRLPAVIRVRCYIRSQQGTPYCRSGEVTIAPKSLLVLPTPIGETPFQIHGVRSPHPLENVAVSLRLRGHPAVIAQVRAGDVDSGGVDNEMNVLGRVESVGPVRNAGEATAEVDIRLAANAQQVDSGWTYNSLPLRSGGTLTLRTNRYELSGLVTGVSTGK